MGGFSGPSDAEIVRRTRSRAERRENSRGTVAQPPRPIPIAFVRERRVEGFVPSRSAAPFEPATRPPRPRARQTESAVGRRDDGALDNPALARPPRQRRGAVRDGAGRAHDRHLRRPSTLLPGRGHRDARGLRDSSRRRRPLPSRSDPGGLATVLNEIALDAGVGIEIADDARRETTFGAVSWRDDRVPGSVSARRRARRRGGPDGKC
jgi:hypothetical protein